MTDDLYFDQDEFKQAAAIVADKPDASVLAEAIRAKPEWFISHDVTHFLRANPDSGLEFMYWDTRRFDPVPKS